MDMSDATHAALAQDLICLGDLKVWSVLVTLFGDLAPDQTDSIPGPVLSALTGQMGIRPEALRVALHRLKKDDWIEATKSGRVSHYKLSAHGRSETKKANPRVFGPFPQAAATWWLVALDSTSARDPGQSGLQLGRGLYLTQNPPRSDAQALIATLTGETIPDWARAAILPQDLQDAYGRLEAILTRHPLTSPPATALEAMTLRGLILHAWRRLALRAPAGALDLMGRDWQGAKCRDRVMQSLAQVPRRAIWELETVAERTPG